MERRILEAIAELASADPFGSTQPIHVAKHLKINIGALARMAPTMQKAGLIEIDEDAGTLSLTEAGNRKVSEDVVAAERPAASVDPTSARLRR